AKAAVALQLKNNPDIFLSTTQVFITLIAILTGVYSGEKFSSNLAPYLEKIGVSPAYSSSLAILVIVIVVTFFSILFGELIPKRLAIMNPESIAKNVARPIKVLSTISYPLVWL